jgi:2-(1,2-epoxy-1,2-dihydrophenyl)acetyl-CoA isomerase
VKQAEPLLVRQIEAGIAELTLNRATVRNALNTALRDALLAAVRAAGADPAVRVVVLRGAGGSFCSGADTADIGAAADPQVIAAMLDSGSAIITAITDCPKPVVAALQGPAVGAGFSLALACDVLVADETAVLHPTFGRIGLAPDWGLSHRLVRGLGLYRAKEILLSCRALDAPDAAALGLVAKVWPTDRFEDELAAYVGALSAGPTAALGVTKRLLNHAADADLAAVLLAESYAALHLVRSADHVEAVRAFAERRPPRFGATDS